MFNLTKKVTIQNENETAPIAEVKASLEERLKQAIRRLDDARNAAAGKVQTIERTTERLAEVEKILASYEKHDEIYWNPYKVEHARNLRAERAELKANPATRADYGMAKEIQLQATVAMQNLDKLLQVDCKNIERLEGDQETAKKDLEAAIELFRNSMEDRAQLIKQRESMVEMQLAGALELIK